MVRWRKPFDQFKYDLFGRTDIVLHTADIVRNRNGFEGLEDARFRKNFYERVNSLVGVLDYSVIACAIRKDYHFRHYGAAAIDLYRISLHKLAELFCDEIGEVRNGGMIIAESRNRTLDQDLEYSWSSLRRRSSGYSGTEKIRDRISSLSLHSTIEENIAGLQTCGLGGLSHRAVISWASRTRTTGRLSKQKLRRGPGGETEDYGLVVLPK